MLQIDALSRLLTPAARKEIVTAIANRLAQITRSNFGPAGMHRPESWKPLSKGYQKRIKYFGPPKLVLSQDLIRSIHVQGASPDRATLMVDSDYASEHQAGAQRLPARPFLPFHGTALTPYAERELQKAGEQAVGRVIQ